MADSFFLDFKKIGQAKRYWQPDSRILLAVSGGVDSMVLLEVMQALQPEVGFTLGVAHVNHQLREESQLEEAYLQDYCKRRHLPFYVTRWADHEANGMEAAARAFRYNFFAEIMANESYDTLMTAHHLDDQAETFLMKLIRGGNLRGHLGILPQRAFASGRLVRPLLSFSKKTVRRFAEERQIKYFEDTTNALPLYQRNRMRLTILPELEKENTQTVEHLAQFSQQLAWAAELIEQQMAELYDKIVTQEAQRYLLDAKQLSEMTEAQQYYFWDAFFQRTLENHGTGIKQQQLTQLMRLIDSQKAQWQMIFENNWQLVKEYQQLIFYQENGDTQPYDTTIMRIPQAGIYLNAAEWLAIFPTDKPCVPPQDVAAWPELRWQIEQPADTSFYLRKRQPGDRIQLSTDLTKRISRWFIDQKVPASARQKAWVVCNGADEILALLPYSNSYLSIAGETDTIQYTLNYRNKNGIMK